MISGVQESVLRDIGDYVNEVIYCNDCPPIYGLSIALAGSSLVSIIAIRYLCCKGNSASKEFTNRKEKISLYLDAFDETIASCRRQESTFKKENSLSNKQ